MPYPNRYTCWVRGLHEKGKLSQRRSFAAQHVLLVRHVTTRHAAPAIRAKRVSVMISQLKRSSSYANSVSIIRDAVLGTAGESGGRKGRVFEENGMRIYDLDDPAKFMEIRRGYGARSSATG